MITDTGRVGGKLVHAQLSFVTFDLATCRMRSCSFSYVGETAPVIYSTTLYAPRLINAVSKKDIDKRC